MHDLTADVDGGNGGWTVELPGNEEICDAIERLQETSQEIGEGEGNELCEDSPLRQIFSHWRWG